MNVSRIRTLVAAGALALTLTTAASGWQDEGGSASFRAPWDKETLELFATLPVQDGGRIKPMDSIAGLKLLQFNGKRTLKLGDGSKLSHTAWLLDCLFFPEESRTYPSFRIENDGVLTSVGLEPRSKRDWYSYNDLVPARARIADAASHSNEVDDAKRSPVQRQMLKLEGDLRQFEALTHCMDLARVKLTTAGLPDLYPEEETQLADVLERVGDFKELWGSLIGEEGDDERLPALRTLLAQLTAASEAGHGGLTFITPHPGFEDTERWWRPADVMNVAFNETLDLSAELDILRNLQRLEAAKNDPASFRAELETLHGSLVERAKARGEYRAVGLEVDLYRWDPFTNSLVLFLLAFILAGFSWMAPGQRWLGWAVWGSSLSATALVVFGITLRCIIRQRPPVVSLYDTILFVTACGVIVALATEWMSRQKVALGMSTVLGVAGMFLAGKYELKEVATSGDTMASIGAVLDTNYYLAIHVTTIALGYAAGLLAGALAHVWILGRLVGFKRGDKAFYKGISRMTYGITCFGLLFAVFGTIMGGVWANDSWGRFWGWDPKENGALLICLWQLIILHARMGGYIRDRGLAVMAVVGGVVVSASWWGVNLLSVGLHSYGFTSGVKLTLYSFWALESLVVLAAGIHLLAVRGTADGKA